MKKLLIFTVFFQLYCLTAKGMSSSFNQESNAKRLELEAVASQDDWLIELHKSPMTELSLQSIIHEEAIGHNSPWTLRDFNHHYEINDLIEAELLKRLKIFEKEARLVAKLLYSHNPDDRHLDDTSTETKNFIFHRTLEMVPDSDDDGMIDSDQLNSFE